MPVPVRQSSQHYRTSCSPRLPYQPLSQPLPTVGSSLLTQLPVLAPRGAVCWLRAIPRSWPASHPANSAHARLPAASVTWRLLDSTIPPLPTCPPHSPAILLSPNSYANPCPQYPACCRNDVRQVCGTFKSRAIAQQLTTITEDESYYAAVGFNVNDLGAFFDITDVRHRYSTQGCTAMVAYHIPY